MNKVTRVILPSKNGALTQLEYIIAQSLNLVTLVEYNALSKIV